MHGVLAQESGPIRAVFGSFENTFLWVIIGVSLIALLFAYYLVREVLGAPEGTEKMKEIAKAIQEGANAYLSRQFRTLAVFVGLIAVVLFFILPVTEGRGALGVLDPSSGARIAFILGAAVSARRPATWGCGSPSARTSAPRTPPASRVCGARCGSPSARAAWPGCSRWDSACSAPR